jgi:hypothetical protein
MTDLERAAAIAKIEALLKATPVGDWGIRDLADIVKHMIMDVKPADVGRVIDKQSGRK